MVQIDTAERAKSRRVSALAGLRPFLAPYRLMILAAGVALVVTASVSLVLPIAVRRVVDGFGVQNAAMLDQYFGAALAVAAVMAVGAGCAITSSQGWGNVSWQISAAHSLTKSWA